MIDPDDRELVISCGAALGHLEVAARHFGREPIVERLPDPSQPDLLARIRLGAAHAPTSDDTRLFPAIMQRRTTREIFSPIPVPAPLVADIEAIGRAEGIAVHAVAERARRDRIAALVAEGDRLRFADPEFRRELAKWIRSRRSARGDGTSADGFDVPDALSGIVTLFMRTFDVGRGVAARDAEIAEGSPLLVVLASEEDAADAWLGTGRVLSRLLLRAAASDVTASYLNQPIENAPLRPRLVEAIDAVGHPQLLLRLGYSERGRPAARRPLEEVLQKGILA